MARKNGEPRRGDRFQSGARSREFKLTPTDHFEMKCLVLSASRWPVGFRRTSSREPHRLANARRCLVADPRLGNCLLQLGDTLGGHIGAEDVNLLELGQPGKVL
jgi:hypothetical protein